MRVQRRLQANALPQAILRADMDYRRVTHRRPRGAIQRQAGRSAKLRGMFRSGMKSCIQASRLNGARVNPLGVVQRPSGYTPNEIGIATTSVA